MRRVTDHEIYRLLFGCVRYTKGQSSSISTSNFPSLPSINSHHSNLKWALLWRRAEGSLLKDRKNTGHIMDHLSDNIFLYSPQFQAAIFSPRQTVPRGQHASMQT